MDRARLRNTVLLITAALVVIAVMASVALAAHQTVRGTAYPVKDQPFRFRFVSWVESSKRCERHRLIKLIYQGNVVAQDRTGGPKQLAHLGRHRIHHHDQWFFVVSHKDGCTGPNSNSLLFP